MSTEQSEAERRRFSRIPFEAAVTVTSPDGKWMGKLKDISLKGVLITRPQNWVKHEGDHFMIEIHPPENPFTIRMEVDAAHVASHAVGFQCTHIDIDSVSHLRRLIELNLGDQNLLNRELADLAQSAAA